MKYKTYSELIRDLDNNTSLVDIVELLLHQLDQIEDYESWQEEVVRGKLKEVRDILELDNGKTQMIVDKFNNLTDKYYSLRDRIDKIQLPNINAENINGELK